MQEYSREDRLASIKAKLDFLIHHLDPRIHNTHGTRSIALSREFKPYISGGRRVVSYSPVK